MAMNVPDALEITLDAITTIAKAIIVVAAVTAARLGWRARLPSASSAVPARAKASASNSPNRRAIGCTRAGPIRIKPTINNTAPSEIRPALPEIKATTARTRLTTPAQKPRVVRGLKRPSPTAGRNASSGVTRLAARAGNSPATNVTPTPSAIESATRPIVTTGPPILRLSNCRPTTEKMLTATQPNPYPNSNPTAVPTTP